MGWSSVMTARLLRPELSRDAPRHGPAHEARRRARGGSPSAAVSRGAPGSRSGQVAGRVAAASGLAGTGSGVRAGGPLGDVGRERARSRPRPPAWNPRALIGSPIVSARSQDFVEQEVAEVGVVELVPGARRRHRGVRATAQRVGRDRRLGSVVLAPVDEHLAGARRSSPCCSTTRSGWSASIARASSRAIDGDLAHWSAHRGRAAYRWMPLLPLVTGKGRAPCPAGSSAPSARPRRTRAGPTPGPGSRSSTSRSGVAAVAVGREPPLRDVQFEARDLGEVDERGNVVDERILLRARRSGRSPAGAPTAARRAPGPSRRTGSARRPTPSGQRLRVTGRPDGMRDQEAARSRV